VLGFFEERRIPQQEDRRLEEQEEDEYSDMGPVPDQKLPIHIIW